MSLELEYGIAIGNRFGQFIDHDEDPDEFLAQQTHAEEKVKKSSKDSKTTTSSASTKKSTTKTSTTATSAVTGANTKTNKENVTGKSTNNEQRKQTNVAFSDNQQQQPRPESGRGSFRGGYPRRGGQDRPSYEGGSRGGGRGGPTPRFNRPEGQQGGTTGGFEQGGEAWNTEGSTDNQGFGGSRGRGRGAGRGRGNYEGGRGNYEGGRGGGRGRFSRGRGYNTNRTFAEGSQGQDQEGSNWEQNAQSNFDNRGQGTGTDAEIQIAPQGQTFESDQPAVRGGRGSFRSRTFRSNRNQGERSHYQEREGDQQNAGQDDYRHNRRQHDRQPRNFVSTVKPIEKKDGQGAHNWGDQTALPDDEPVVDDNGETTATTPAGATGTKDWSQQVDEAEKQMTLDEYKKQLEEKKKLNQDKLPQLNRRTAGEGEDPKVWKKPEVVYRKKNDDEESEEEDEGESGAEEGGSGDEAEEEQTAGKKKIINIPLQFKPLEGPRGPSGARGGRRGSGRYSDRPSNRDEQARAPSPSQQQTPGTSSQPTGDDERPQSGYRGGRGGSRGQGSGRGEYRRSYGNAARGSRGGSGGYNPSSKGEMMNTLDFGNTKEFPTLPKQE